MRLLRTTGGRLGVLVAATLLYVGLFYLLFPIFDLATAILALGSVMLAGALFGMGPGMFAGLALAIITNAMLASIGRGGSSLYTQALLGSVAAAVAVEAPCAVEIIRMGRPPVAARHSSDKSTHPQATRGNGGSGQRPAARTPCRRGSKTTLEGRQHVGSVIFTLVVILQLGFAAVGLVGVLGCRARMRRDVLDVENHTKAA